MIADLAALRREAEQLAESLEKDYGYRLWASIVRRLLEALTEMEQEAANWQDAYDQDHAAMIAGDEQIVELDKERSRLEASLLALRGYVQHTPDGIQYDPQTETYVAYSTTRAVFQTRRDAESLHAWRRTGAAMNTHIGRWEPATAWSSRRSMISPYAGVGTRVKAFRSTTCGLSDLLR